MVGVGSYKPPWGLASRQRGHVTILPTPSIPVFEKVIFDVAIKLDKGSGWELAGPFKDRVDVSFWTVWRLRYLVRSKRIVREPYCASRAREHC